MAVNPMKRKTRTAFILGFLVALLISLIVICFLYTEKNKASQALKKYTDSLQNVYVLNQNVKSGQVLTAGMFRQEKIPLNSISTEAKPENILNYIAQMSIYTEDGDEILIEQQQGGEYNYYIQVGQDKRYIYMNDENGKLVKATALIANTDNKKDRAFYYAGANDNTDLKEIKIKSNENIVISKIDLAINTIVTPSMLTRTDEKITADVRKEEYNVIDLPIDLFTGDYIDIRLMLPNGTNYIVVSKKKATVPMTSTGYSADTIQIDLAEDEILKMSAAIIENYQIKGSKLYATRYVEAGMQSASTETYIPNDEVISLIKDDANALDKAVAGIQKRQRNAINQALRNHGDEDSVGDSMEEDSATSREARKEYLESLGGGAPVQ